MEFKWIWGISNRVFHVKFQKSPIYPPYVYSNISWRERTEAAHRHPTTVRVCWMLMLSSLWPVDSGGETKLCAGCAKCFYVWCVLLGVDGSPNTLPLNKFHLGASTLILQFPSPLAVLLVTEVRVDDKGRTKLLSCFLLWWISPTFREIRGTYVCSKYNTSPFAIEEHKQHSHYISIPQTPGLDPHLQFFHFLQQTYTSRCHHWRIISPDPERLTYIPMSNLLILTNSRRNSGNLKRDPWSFVLSSVFIGISR